MVEKGSSIRGQNGYDSNGEKIVISEDDDGSHADPAYVPKEDLSPQPPKITSRAARAP